MTEVVTWNTFKTMALRARPRLFEEVINLDYDNLPYIGHLVTKTAIEAGYVARRSNLKGNTILEWSRSSSVDGRGAPNQWACLAAVDLIIGHRRVPEPDDVELQCAIAYYWYLAHGPFTSVEAALVALAPEFASPMAVRCIEAAIKNITN